MPFDLKELERRKKEQGKNRIGDFSISSPMADEVQGGGAGYDPQKFESLKRAVLPQFDPLKLKRFQDLKNNPGLEFDELLEQEKLAKKAQEELLRKNILLNLSH